MLQKVLVVRFHNPVLFCSQLLISNCFLNLVSEVNIIIDI